MNFEFESRDVTKKHWFIKVFDREFDVVTLYNYLCAEENDEVIDFAWSKVYTKDFFIKNKIFKHLGSHRMWASAKLEENGYILKKFIEDNIHPKMYAEEKTK